MGKYKSGQVIYPHYRSVFSGVSRSLVVSSACGIFAGRRWACLFILGIYFMLQIFYICWDALTTTHKFPLPPSFSLILIFHSFDRFPSSLGTRLPSKLPWTFIPYKEYWLLCRHSVLSCMADNDSHLSQWSNSTYAV